MNGRRSGSSVSRPRACSRWRRSTYFPVMLETFREVLQDVFDLPRARSALHGVKDPADRRRGRRERIRLAVFVLAPVRLHRDVHVRGRHASRRAAGAGAVPRPRSSASCSARRSCATCSIPARSTRSSPRWRARRSGSGRAARPAPAARRPAAGRVRRGSGRPRGRAEGRTCSRRRRGAADRSRGCGPVPRRARRDAAERATRCLPRADGGAAAPAACTLARGRGPFGDRGGRAVRRRRRARGSRAGGAGAR